MKDDDDWVAFMRAILRKARPVKSPDELPSDTVRVCVRLSTLPPAASCGFTWCSRCGQPCTYNQREMPLTDNQRPVCTVCLVDDMKEHV